MFKQLIIITSLICAILLTACEAKQPQSPAKLPAGTVTINNTTFKVEIADTPAARAQGLSGRTKLEPYQGMYFIFPFARTQTFWMKEMQLPLDMVWIKDNTVLAVTADIPPPALGTALQDLKHYASPRPADAILEINAGAAKAAKIQSGDKVHFERVDHY